MGRLTCHAVDDPACSCEPAGDGGDATGGGESGRLPKAFGEGDDELAITGGGTHVRGGGVVCGMGAARADTSGMVVVRVRRGGDMVA